MSSRPNGLPFSRKLWRFVYNIVNSVCDFDWKTAWKNKWFFFNLLLTAPEIDLMATDSSIKKCLAKSRDILQSAHVILKIASSSNHQGHATIARIQYSPMTMYHGQRNRLTQLALMMSWFGLPVVFELLIKSNYFRTM